MINIIKKFFPKFIKKKILEELDKNNIFSGWSMQTKTCPPWMYISADNNKNSALPYFLEIQKELEDNIKSNYLTLNQFGNKSLEKVIELRWRHYIVALSIKFAIKEKNEINLVEAGVADGLTAWFALKVINKEKKMINKFYLYDSWEKMNEKYLDKKEYKKIDKFSKNDLENTKNNLREFSNIEYIKGFIPNVFEDKDIKHTETCNWLHIDLNSSGPTIDTLNFFEKKMLDNGVILFDDFGWVSHELARVEVEKWCAKRNGILWPFPTGQAIFFFNKNK